MNATMIRVFVIGLLLTGRICSAAEIVAAPNGSPSGAGTVASPVTIQEAQVRARGLAANQTEAIYVTLRGGTYQLQQPLTFTSQDSGRNGWRVYYRNYAGETPILSGGRTVGAWNQVSPSLVGGVTGVYSSTDITADTRQLYLDQTRLIRARSSIRHDYEIPSVPLSLSGTSGFSITTTGGYAVLDDTRYTAPIHQWAAIPKVELVLGNDWIHTRTRVASATSSFVTMTQPAFQRIVSANAATAVMTYTDEWHKPDTFWVENALELLDSSGEWYISGDTSRTVYLKPPENVNLTSGGVPVIAPVLSSIIAADGLSNVTFSGIAFKYATWLGPNSTTGFSEKQANFRTNALPGGFTTVDRTPGNISFIRSKYIDIADCTFAHLGAVGLDLDEGCQYFTIQRNVFYDISGTAIQIGSVLNRTESDTNKQVVGNLVSYNYITNAACEYRGGVGIFLGHTRNCTVDHNELYGLPYTGVSVGWDWIRYYTSPYVYGNVVTNNRITKHMQYLFDGGGIYTLSTQGSSFSNGLIINHNFISKGAYGFNQLYFDGGSSFVTASENVVHDNYIPYDFGGNENYDLDIRGNYVNTASVENFRANLGQGWVPIPPSQFPTFRLTVSNNTEITNLSAPAVSAIVNSAGLGAYSSIKGRAVINPSIASRLANHSTRCRVDSSHAIIAGLIIQGTTPKQVLIRALGPALAPVLPGYNANPNITLYGPGGVVVAQNDNWSTNSNAAAIVSAASVFGATPLQSGSADAALLVTLNPGAYTAVVFSPAGVSGEVLAEVFEADYQTNQGSGFSNGSGRCNIPTGGAAVVGFVVRGATPKRVIVRAVGPTLASQGVTGAIPNPKLELYRNQTKLKENDSWMQVYNTGLPNHIAKLAKDADAFPLQSSAEAAIVATLAPGDYTAVVSGADGAGGEVLLEVYDVDVK